MARNRDTEESIPESTNPNTPPVANVDAPAPTQFENQRPAPSSWEERRDQAMAILNGYQVHDLDGQNFVAQLRAVLSA